MQVKNDRSLVDHRRLMMRKIDPFNAGKLPGKDMLQFTQDVNELIEQYNKAAEQEKINILRQIQLKIKEINYKFPPNYLATSGYKAVHTSLLQNIQEQYNYLGASSLITSAEALILLPKSLPI